ncbi:MAG: DUF2147 domain-containing protein [Brumimicrobium sp.]|nr:DUF2147 domain-containing protein [Brumimicrobium sp.]
MKLFTTFIFILIYFCSYTQIEGVWKTVDDETGEKKAVVKIYKKKDGKYYGKILEILKDLPFDSCDKCEGELKGKPLIGLEFVQRLEKKGTVWVNGTITEPKSGKSYDCKAEINNKGQLEIRAYIGIPFIGRTQTWIRMN